jgi:hypothetical protein
VTVSSRTLIDVLGLREQDVFYASSLAWLLDPLGTHELDRNVLRQLAKFLQIHKPGLAPALLSDTLPVSCVLVRPGTLPQLRIVAGGTRLALLFTTHETLGPQDRPPPGYVPIAVGFDDTASNALLTWPLGQLYLALNGAQPAHRWAHFVGELREHLGAELAEHGIDPSALVDPVAPPAPAPAPMAPAAPVETTPNLSGYGVEGAGWGADAPSSTPDAGLAWGAGGLGGGGLADQWELDSLTPEEADPAQPEPVKAPEPIAPTATLLDAQSLNLDADVQFAGSQTLLDAAGATLLGDEVGPSPGAGATTRLGRGAPQNQTMLRVIMELQKGIGYFRLYPQEHPFCAQALDDSFKAFSVYFELFGAMEVRVDRDGIYLDDAMILADSGDAGSFVSLLYPEGIRSMTFERNLEVREIHSFVEALAGQEDGDVAMGNDLLSNLWRRDFSNIVYLTYDQLSPQGLKNVRDPTLLPLAQRIQQLVGGMNAEGETDAELNLFYANQGELDLTQPTSWAGIPARAEQYCASPEGQQRQLFRASVLDTFLGDTLGRSADLVSWLNTHEEYAANRVDEANFIAGLVLNALWQSKLDTALGVIARAAGTGSGGLMSDELMLRLGNEQSVLVFARCLLDHTKLGPVQLSNRGMRYFSHLKPESFDTVCRIAVLQVDDDVRHVFMKFIATKADTEAATIDRMSTRITDEFCAELCKALERTEPGKKLLKRFAADSSNAERAKYAFASVGKATGTFSREKDLHILEKFPIKKERVDAAKRVIAAKDGAAFNRLKALVSGKEFAKRDSDEQDLIFEAVITIGGSRAIAALTEISKRKGGLFGKAAAQKTAGAATRWLIELRSRGAK